VTVSSAVLSGVAQLRKSLSPNAVAFTSDTPGYDQRRMLLNRRFDYRPAVIVACVTDNDVALTIRFARDQQMRISIRAGGTSPGGFSSNNGGVQLDLSGFNQIVVDLKTMSVQVGAGVLLEQLVEKLGPTNFMVPVGECLPVGLSGFALGGGFGLLSRSMGLGCDNILEATVVTAHGLVVTANEQVNPDLFWALRGAGGGNFGVVTSLTMRLHPVPPEMSFATVVWPEAQAAQVLKTVLPYFAGEAPDQLNAVFSMLPMQGVGRAIGTMAVYHGPPDQAKPFLARLTGIGTPLRSNVGTMPYWKILTGIPNQAADIHDYYKSGFVTGVLPDAAVETVVAGFARAREIVPTLMNMVAFELAGGAINRVAPTATAFVHRRHTLLLSIVASWVGAAGVADPAEKRWADDVYTSMQPYFSGEVYQNYPDLELPDPGRAYYGENLDRLRAVKRSFDPDNVFRFSQGITPA
jgi:FAD/FMN-containing dehydrogenase